MSAKLVLSVRPDDPDDFNAFLAMALEVVGELIRQGATSGYHDTAGGLTVWKIEDEG